MIILKVNLTGPIPHHVSTTHTFTVKECHYTNIPILFLQPSLYMKNKINFSK